MKELAINKKRSLVNLSNSILKWFEHPTFHDSLEKVDELLKKSNKKKVSLILLDGFGTAIANYYKENCPFIFSHKYNDWCKQSNIFGYSSTKELFKKIAKTYNLRLPDEFLLKENSVNVYL